MDLMGLENSKHLKNHMHLLQEVGIVRYTVLMQSCLWPLLCFCGYKVFLTDILSNYQNTCMENGTNFASIFEMFPRLQMCGDQLELLLILHQFQFGCLKAN